MKIAIKGHESRGKEVIQILESLGGKNKEGLNGSKESWYFINSDGYIRNDYKSLLQYKGFKTYTLEEFEKEFPFKIGDRVISLTTDLIGTIIKLSENGVYHFKYDNGINSFASASYLKLYKEMKEERNITLTLDKAKEWYNKGGELKEVALQAYSEEELNPLPRSWEEFATNHARMGYYISSDGTPLMCASSGKLSSPHVCPSKESAEAHLAMIQLEQLRNCWRQGWKPKPHESVYTIKLSNEGLRVYYFSSREFLSFPTKEMAEEFSECFKDLIEKAGDLI